MADHVSGKDVATALRRLADAIEQDKVENVHAVNQLEFAQVMELQQGQRLAILEVPTGNAVMLVHYKVTGE